MDQDEVVMQWALDVASQLVLTGVVGERHRIDPVALGWQATELAEEFSKEALLDGRFRLRSAADLTDGSMVALAIELLGQAIERSEDDLEI